MKQYRISGSNKTSTKKGTTFGYELFETNSEKKFIKYVSTHAVCPAIFKKGHRKTDNITEILPFIRIDVDIKGADKKVQKALRKSKTTFIKKPSISNIEKGESYKWHYIVPISNVSQNYDGYKLQYYKFLSEHKIDIEWVDKSLASVVQNMNPAGEESSKVTTPSKGKIWKAPNVKPPTRKKYEEKHSDVPKSDVKRALRKIDPDCSYSDWLMVGMAMYDWCPKKGFKLFDKWSKKSDKYDGTTSDKWSDFENNISGDVTLGTLMHLAYGDKVEPTSMFKKEEGDVIPLTKKEKRKKVKADKKKAKKDKMEFDPLNVGGQLDDAMLKERKNQKVLFDSVVVERMHTFIYGAAGSNKTTVISWISCDILQRHKDKTVHFWSFDAADNHENAMFNYGKDKRVDDRFHIYTSKTSEDYQSHYEKAVEYESDLSSLIIVIDTWKFVSKDVNSKGANKEAMHFIKKLQALGATIISLGHTNKDGIKNSGTAEIEQDSDAVLRIDRKADEFSREVTLTIEAAGRVRFSCAGVSFKSTPKGNDYKYLYTALTSMVKSEFVSLSEEVEEKREDSPKVSAKDRRIVDELERIIDELNDGKNTRAFQSLIILEAKRQEKISEVKTTALLREYAKDKWLFSQKKNKGGKKEKCYKCT